MSLIKLQKLSYSDISYPELGLNRWKYTPSNIKHIPMVMVTLSILIIVLSFTPNLYVIQDMCKS
ncbi:MAG: hypothetical protein Alis3KO_34340 [Aliiglaciecola sp.]